MILDLIPLWAILGIAAALVSTAIPLFQEKNKANPLALAIIVKTVSAIVILPVVLHQGLPANLNFYLAVSLTSLLWAISDVIYYRAVTQSGAGVVSRLLPSAVVFSFILWFFFDPSLLDRYLANPVQAALIVSIIALSAFFAMQIRKCPVSWKGFRLVWFVIFAACTGPLLEKMTLGQAPLAQAPYAFVFVQSCFMLGFWLIFLLIRKPIKLSTLTSYLSLKTGLVIGLCSALAVTLRFMGLQEADHPAYLSILLFTDALWIVLYHKMIGREDGSNIKAGLGIVFCAVALVVIKSPILEGLFW
ncbi:MAG: hypothetical protein DI586_00735 [Micavibrio aeruginosavorus]|uniref:EamA domain-containing protein n=1 Tax=Micavibrio aeruginosavorus TaxID=349221 RepID=A0A2W5HUM6_9BACT|nr:MAG: hypothetical protein DI586_00735 [Micavibrio aeruginosavorus]